jgi:hypothetical protein
MAPAYKLSYFALRGCVDTRRLLRRAARRTAR